MVSQVPSRRLGVRSEVRSARRGDPAPARLAHFPEDATLSRPQGLGTRSAPCPGLRLQLCPAGSFSRLRLEPKRHLFREAFPPPVQLLPAPLTFCGPDHHLEPS